MSRLPPSPRERIDRERPISFSFDGGSVEAFEGDTIGSALAAGGRRVLSRSFKYHRPRGLFCCAGQCPNCLVEVDGWPGVRACTEPVREGMRVSHMNAKPSLRFDLMRGADLFGKRLSPPGFYYKTFIRPRRLWPLYEKALRHAAGLGRLPRRQAEREWRTEYRRRHADLLVVGGGVAGMAAALRAAELGADVVLVDDGPELGGALLTGAGADDARELGARVRAAGVEVLAPAAALGFFDGLVPVWCESTLHQVRAERHVAATGSIEQPLMFEGNDLPGVMLCSGAHRLASLYRVRPGEAAVVATTADHGLEAALALREAGVAIVGIADARPSGADEELSARVESAGIPLLRGSAVVRALGRRQVRGAVVAELDEAGRWIPDTERGINCDLVAVSGGTVPATSLLLQAGAKARWDQAAGAYLPDGSPPGIHAAGAVAGHGSSPSLAETSGAVAGAEAALSLELGAEQDRARLLGEREALLRGAEPATEAVPAATSGAARGHGKCFACLCEDVTTDDIGFSIDEGFDSLELLKRYTTVTMGPCQGRMCQLPSVRQMSEETGTAVGEVGLTTARPPWSSVPMGVLAGRPFEPAKRSAVHGRHRELGGNVLWAGDWRRPYDYGDPNAETMAVHEGAGLIDVSTLGKLIVRGPEADAFLNLLYPNRFDNLKVGRVRYGVLGDDAGRITDDGTVCRLDDRSFYVTTTSSGADAVESWFAWWLSEWDLDVHLTDVSQGLAAFNLAGPRSREILSGLTDLDCSNDSFAYLDGKRTQVAGVPCLLLRIGFVGELGYELHCPAALAEHLWDSVLEAGEPHGIRPFGLEPQRVLRLQKLHILVGQDTDAESNALEAAMPWIVKLDKEEDFIGRWALESVQERGAENTLVGFTITNGAVPNEGAAVVVDGRPVGRVTSSRFSPLLRRTIGMAWVPAALAEEGVSITLADDGQRLSAQVQTAPFYDPDQEKLRG
ncbi:MAG: 2Fe-2S iron-sulfur cluster-binding protein [Solirubrobacterales bacterium]